VALVRIKDAGLKRRQNRHLGTIAQRCRAISSQLRHISKIGKKLIKKQYVLQMSAKNRHLGTIAQLCLFNIKAKGHEGHLHCSTQYKYNSTRLLTKTIYYRVTIAKMFDTIKM